MLPLLNPVHEKRSHPSFLRVFSVAVFFLSTSSIAFAQQPSSEDGRRGPPKEAFTVCEDLSKEDVCTFKTPRGELNGVCLQDRRSEALLCVPKDKPKMSKRSKDVKPEDTKN